MIVNLSGRNRRWEKPGPITTLTGFAVFASLLVFSIIFYRERALTIDAALHNFYIIMRNTTSVQWVRCGSILTQAPPLICHWLGLPLKAMLYAHSIGFIVFYFIIFCFIVFAFKQPGLGIAYLLTLTLLSNDCFYWMTSEVPQGMAMLMLYAAFLRWKGVGVIYRHPILNFLAVYFIQSYHPLLVAPILFALFYLVYEQYGNRLTAYIKPVVICAVSFFIRYMEGRTDWYEGPRLDIIPMLKANLPHLLQLQSTHQVWHLAHHNHLFFWIYLAVVVAILIMYWRFITALAVIGFTVGYLAVVCAVNPDAPKFYLENMMLPITIFTALPLAVYLKRNALGNPIVATVLAVTFLVRLDGIYHAHTPYTNRLNWYTAQFATMRNMHTPKVVMPENRAPMDTMIMSWSSQYESLLLSSLNGPKQSLCLVIDNDTGQYLRLTVDSLFPRWEKPPVAVRQNYFNPAPVPYVLGGK